MYLAKKVWPHIIEIKRSKKQSLELFKGDNDKNIHFRKKYLRYQNRRQLVEGEGPMLLHSKIKELKPKQKYSISKQRKCKYKKRPSCRLVINTSLTIQKEVPANNNTVLLPLIKITILSMNILQ